MESRLWLLLLQSRRQCQPEQAADREKCKAMNMSKLRSLHVIIIGAVVCVIVGVGLFFVLIKPTRVKIAETQQQYDASKQIADQEPQALRERDKAIEESQKAQLEYAKYQKSKMPNIDFTDRGQGMLDLWKEQAIILGPLVQKWPSKNNVRLISAIQVPAPPVNPNMVQTEIIEIPLGPVQIMGSFDKILKSIEAWNNFNRLVRIDYPSLQGSSPNLVSQFNITVYIFPRGKPGPQIQIAGQGGTTGVPGMPGGMPMGGTPPGPMPPGVGAPPPMPAGPGAGG